MIACTFERSDFLSSIGTRLRQERERQGRTLKEVADATNIKEAYLAAVETERFDTIPGVVFVKGFIRTYANYLGLNGDALVEEYKESFVSRTPQPEVRPVTGNPVRKERGKERRRQGKWQEITLVAGIILFLLLIIWLLL